MDTKPEEKPSKARQRAEQFEALLKRHRVGLAEIQRRVTQAGGDRVTVYRVYEGKAKTEPKAATLRLIAAAVGETIDQAFPESGEVIDKPDESLIIPAEPGEEPAFALKQLSDRVPEEMRREAEQYVRYMNKRFFDQVHAIKAKQKPKKK